MKIALNKSSICQLNVKLPKKDVQVNLGEGAKAKSIWMYQSENRPSLLVPKIFPSLLSEQSKIKH